MTRESPRGDAYFNSTPQDILSGGTRYTPYTPPDSPNFPPSTATSFEEPNTLVLLPVSTQHFDSLMFLLSAPCDANAEFCGWDHDTGLPLSSCGTACEASGYSLRGELRTQTGCDDGECGSSITYSFFQLNALSNPAADQAKTRPCGESLNVKTTCCADDPKGDQDCIGISTCDTEPPNLNTFFFERSTNDDENDGFSFQLPTPPDASGINDFCVSVAFTELEGFDKFVVYTRDPAETNDAAPPSRREFPISDLEGGFQVCGRKCDFYCADLHGCSTCQRDAACGWCGESSSCIPGNALGPIELFNRADITASDIDHKDTPPQDEPIVYPCSSNYHYSGCCSSFCASHFSCTDCTATAGCGWCEETSTCMPTITSFLTQPTCPASCPTFITEPTCSIPPTPLTQPPFPSHTQLHSNSFDDNSLQGFEFHNDDDDVSVAVWESNTQRLKQSASTDGTVFATVTAGMDIWEDYVFETTFRSTDSGIVGVAFRYTSPTSHYRFEWGSRVTWSCNPQNLRMRQLVRVTPSSSTTLRSQPIGYTKGADYKLRIHIIGHEITVFINDQHLWSIIDDDDEEPDLPARGTIAPLTRSNAYAEFDDLAIFGLIRPLALDAELAVTSMRRIYTSATLPALDPTDVVQLRVTLDAPSVAASAFLSTTTIAFDVDEPTSTALVRDSNILNLRIRPPATTPTTVYAVVHTPHITEPLPTTLHLSILSPTSVPFLEPFSTSTPTSSFLGVLTIPTPYDFVELVIQASKPVRAYVSLTAPPLEFANARSDLLESTTLHVDNPTSTIYFSVFSADAFTLSVEQVYPAPSITTITPAAGSRPTSITAITIAGTDFGDESSASVSFAGQPCEITSFLPERIICSLPADSAGSTNQVIVASREVIASDPFTFAFDPPVVNAIQQPTSVPTNPVDRTLQITGSSFGTLASQAVTLLALESTLLLDCAITSSSHTSIECTIPPGVGSDIPIRVTVADQSVTTNDVNGLLSYDAPTISSTLPPTIAAVDGTLTVYGANFGIAAATVTLTINSNLCLEPTNHTHSTVVCPLTPVGSGKTNTLIVCVDSRCITSTVAYTPPVIHRVAPTSVDTTGNVLLTVTGRHFGLDSINVLIGTYPCSPQPDHNDTTVFCLIPAGEGADLDVVVNVAAQASNTVSFSFHAPTIDDVKPQLGLTRGSSPVTVTGTNFGLAPAVTIGPRACVVTDRTHSSIVCTLPEGSGTTNEVNVEVAGQITATSFNYAYAPPVITGLDSSPYPPPPLGSVFLTIDGANFGDSASPFTVSITSPTTPVSCSVSEGVRTHDRIRCLLGRGAGRDHAVSVNINGQVSNGNYTFSFAPPQIGSVTLRPGLSAILSIVGSNFGDQRSQASVQVGSYPCPLNSDIAFGDTSFACNLVRGQGTHLPVAVQVGDQSTVAPVDQWFSYPPPTIDVLKPADTSLVAGTNVTVIGRHFGVDFDVSLTPCVVYDDQFAEIVSGAWSAAASFDAHSGAILTAPVPDPTLLLTILLELPFAGSYDVFVSYLDAELDHASSINLVHASATTAVDLGTAPPSSARWIHAATLAFARDDMLNVTAGASPTCKTTPCSIYVDAIRLCPAPLSGSPLPLDIAPASVTARAHVTALDGPAPFGTDAADEVTTVIFPAPPGVGSNVRVSLNASQLSAESFVRASPLSYARPVVTSVSGCGDESSPPATYGCSVSTPTPIVIYGRNFGPASLEAVAGLAVTIGGVAVDPASISLISDTELHCDAPAHPRGGNSLDVVVTSFGLVSDPAALLSYAGPKLTGGSLFLCSDGAGTASNALSLTSPDGGVDVCFSGENLGTDLANIDIYFGNPTYNNPDSSFTFPDAPTAALNGDSSLWYRCVPVSLDPVRCTLPPGTGRDLRFVVRAGLLYSPQSAFRVHYPDPTLVSNSIRASPSASKRPSLTSNSTQGSDVIFDVTNLPADNALFDSLLHVDYINRDDSRSSFQECQRPHVTTYVGGRYLKCRTQPGGGPNHKFRLRSANHNVTADSDFTYNYPIYTPYIDSVAGCSPCEGDPLSTCDCPTIGGPLLTLTGANFCDPEASITACSATPVTVRVGARSCGDVLVLNSTYATCRLPSGSGSGIFAAVSMVSAGAFSAQYELLSFRRATLTSVTGCSDVPLLSSTENCPKTGGTVVTITGANFAEANAVVLIGGVPCASPPEHDTTFPHSILRCELPHGLGTSLPVQVIPINSEISLAPPDDFVELSYEKCAPGTRSNSRTDADADELCLPCEPGKFSDEFGAAACQSCDGGTYAPDEGASQCLSCAAGNFSTRGSAQCELCPAGKVTGESGQASCTKCPRGSYTSEAGRSVCSLCRVGHFLDAEAGTECEECETGRFSSRNGSAVCSDCPPGTYGPTRGLSTCESCSAGTFQQRSGQAACTECDVGYEAIYSGLLSCSSCQPGHFANVTGLAECHECPPGTAAPTFGSTECEPCRAGFITAASGERSCIPCLRGSYAPEPSSTECLECPNGTFSAGTGQSSCQTCELGMFSSVTGAVACQPCQKGRFTLIPDGATPVELPGDVPRFPSDSCTACPLGKYQGEDGQSVCLDCEAGRYAADEGAVACLECAPGTAAPEQGAPECTECTSGKYAPFRSLECKSCDPGSYTNLAGLSICQPCAPGSFTNESNSVACRKCPAGRFASSTGHANCEACPIGSFSADVASASCFPCGKGSYAPTEASVACEQCPAGTFQDDVGEGGCEECALGRASASPGQPSCAVCPPGRFANETRSSVCHECPRGWHQPESGASFCEQCEPGRFVADSGLAACTDCTVGRFANVSGATRCSLCPKGTASKELGASECFECVQGFFASVEGQSQCFQCEAGRFAKATAATTCDSCQAGRFSARPSSIGCERCPAGRFGAFSGTSGCEQCAAGRFTNTSGELSCLACGAGTNQPEVGKTSCVQCEPGSAQVAEGQRSCTLCEPGTYSADSGAFTCLPCTVGHYQRFSGQTGCLECGPGEAAVANRSASCSKCPAGRHAPGSASAACTSCEPGFFSRDAGALSCDACPAGRSSPREASGCVLCGDFEFTAGPGQVCQDCDPGQEANDEHTKCQCPIGQYFGSASVTNPNQPPFGCHDCPEGAVCNLPGLTRSALTVEAGWWRTNNQTLTMYRCLIPDHCVGGSTAACDDFRTGPLCAICEDGTKEDSNGRCQPCSGNRDSQIVVMFFVFLAIVLGLCVMYFLIIFSDRKLMQRVKEVDLERIERFRLSEQSGGFDELAEPILGHEVKQYRTQGRPNITFKIKILLGFFQVATNLVSSLNMPWPDGFSNFISAFNIFNVDFVQWSSVSCVTSIDYYDKLVMVCCIPVVTLLTICATYLLPYYVLRHPGGLPLLGKRDHYNIDLLARKRRRRKFWKISLFTLFLVYPFVSALIFRMYVCREVEGEWYLTSDFNIPCFDARWKRYLPFNVLMMIVYPIGVPAFFLYMLFRYRTRFRDPAVRMQLGFLYDGYGRTAWFFELVDMAHKLTLTSLLGFFPPDAQMPVGMVVCYGYAIVILVRNPYFRKGDTRLHLFAQAEIYLILLGGYIFYRNDNDDLDDTDDAVMSVFLIVAIFGFLIVFAAQTLNIFRKIYRDLKRIREQQRKDGTSSSNHRLRLGSLSQMARDKEADEEGGMEMSSLHGSVSNTQLHAIEAIRQGEVKRNSITSGVRFVRNPLNSDQSLRALMLKKEQVAEDGAPSESDGEESGSETGTDRVYQQWAKQKNNERRESILATPTMAAAVLEPDASAAAAAPVPPRPAGRPPSDSIRLGLRKEEEEEVEKEVEEEVEVPEAIVEEEEEEENANVRSSIFEDDAEAGEDEDDDGDEEGDPYEFNPLWGTSVEPGNDLL